MSDGLEAISLMLYNTMINAKCINTLQKNLLEAIHYTEMLHCKNVLLQIKPPPLKENQIPCFYKK